MAVNNLRGSVLRLWEMGHLCYLFVPISFVNEVFKTVHLQCNSLSCRASGRFVGILSSHSFKLRCHTVPVRRRSRRATICSANMLKSAKLLRNMVLMNSHLNIWTRSLLYSMSLRNRISFRFAQLTDSVTGHQFHLRIFRGTRVLLHVIGVMPDFITNGPPQKRQNPTYTQRFVDTNNLPPLMANAGVAILGIMGVHYENTRLRHMFLKITSEPSNPPEMSNQPGNNVVIVPKAYSVIKSAVESYTVHWKGCSIVERKDDKNPRILREPAIAIGAPQEPERTAPGGRENATDELSGTALEASGIADDDTRTTERNVLAGSSAQTPENTEEDVDTANDIESPKAVQSDDTQKPDTDLPRPKRRKISPARGEPPTKKRQIYQDTRNKYSRVKTRRGALFKDVRNAIKTFRSHRNMATRLTRIDSTAMLPKSKADSTVTTTEPPKPTISGTQAAKTAEQRSLPNDEGPKLRIAVISLAPPAATNGEGSPPTDEEPKPAVDVSLLLTASLSFRMSQRHREMFERCPYGLSRLAALDGDTLEYITGIELMGILLLAKQHGRLSGYKDIWSRRPVKNVWLEEDLKVEGNCCALDSPKDLAGMSLADVSKDGRHLNSIQTPTRTSNRSAPGSPFTDPSPSPPPHVTRERFIGNETHYSYSRAIVGGIKLPILLVGYFHHETTTRKICCYGGSQNHERCFLTSWE